MRIFEFLIRLFSRFSPVDKETISDLSFQLKDYHTTQTDNYLKKMENNEKVTAKAVEIKEKLKGLDVGSQEHDNLLFEFTELQGQLVKPTLMEKALIFLDKPMVKLALMVAFIFVSKYILNKITGTKKAELEEEEAEPITAQKPHYPSQQMPNYWNPNNTPVFYGHGYDPRYPQQQ